MGVLFTLTLHSSLIDSSPALFSSGVSELGLCAVLIAGPTFFFPVIRYSSLWSRRPRCARPISFFPSQIVCPRVLFCVFCHFASVAAFPRAGLCMASFRSLANPSYASANLCPSTSSYKSIHTSLAAGLGRFSFIPSASQDPPIEDCYRLLGLRVP